ncbi:MAG: SAM-dependent methyltransferase [Salaquimonas sp.]
MIENNPEQLEFISACETALKSGNFKRITFSSRDKGSEKFRCSFTAVLGETKTMVRYSDNQPHEDVTNQLDVDGLISQMKSGAISPFKAATLNTSEFDLHYSENRKMEPRLYKTKASMKDVVQTHNKQKQYALKEDRPYLKGLGVSTDSGKVHKKHYPKFRQIANFVEIIDRDIGAFVQYAERPISILDLGCGKGYLTFATYDYIRSRAKHEPQARGIDIKTNVIELCNKLAGRLSFSGLKFINAKIEPNKIEPVDILIALHACDTATDDALALGVRSQMKYLFCAPCCQAEIAQQLGKGESAFETINQFPLMKRRQADLVTDVSRALLLNALGYEVKFLEFTPLEHTAKNLMLVGKQSELIDREKAYQDYVTLKAETGFECHSFEENIKDLLPV